METDSKPVCESGIEVSASVKKYPALCQKCSEHHDRDGYACGLMVEAMAERVPVVSCVYFLGVQA